MPRAGAWSSRPRASTIDDGRFVDQHLVDPGPTHPHLGVGHRLGHGQRDPRAHLRPFTTKEKEQGHGARSRDRLRDGLHSEGKIWAYSEPDRERRSYHFPRSPGAASPRRHRSHPSRRAAGRRRVSVVETRTRCRFVAVDDQKKAGYKVLEASDEKLCGVAFATRKPSIISSSTDVLHAGNPRPGAGQGGATAMRALFMSGHADDALLHHGMLEGGLSFLEKPFTRRTSPRKVREVLDGA